MRTKLLSASNARLLERAQSSMWNRCKAHMLASLATLGLLLSIAPAKAQTLSTLYTFQGSPDGGMPYGGLVEDSTGAFYGTTQIGGDNSCGSLGCGTVYKLVGTKESWVYSFKGYPDDGETPGYINLVTDGKGNFYGTTAYGGNGPCKLNGIAVGCGTIFKITSAGKETVLYNFQWGTKDGAGPNSTLILDSATGVLYGTTQAGGDLIESCDDGAGCGTIFQFTLSSNTEKILYTFCAVAECHDGAGPRGMLALDSTGNLYGTTASGGTYLDGTVYKFATSTSKESVLHSFCAKKGCPDGEGPMGGVTLNAKTSILYGTALSGGSGVCGSTTGGGTLFQITTAGASFKVLHDFSSASGNGCEPWGTVVMDTSGNLYGTTSVGGNESLPLGTVYEYSTSGKESVLASFGGLDGQGAQPYDTLIYEKGALYGTTWTGGGGSGCTETASGGCGLVFKLVP
jgi:uncharacterized repeat protein (TIGR03803 family)